MRSSGCETGSPGDTGARSARSAPWAREFDALDMLDAPAKQRVVDKRRIREMRHEAGVRYFDFTPVMIVAGAGSNSSYAPSRRALYPHDQIAEARAMAEKFSAHRTGPWPAAVGGR
jgi:hypothetical protein